MKLRSSLLIIVSTWHRLIRACPTTPVYRQKICDDLPYGGMTTGIRFWASLIGWTTEGVELCFNPQFYGCVWEVISARDRKERGKREERERKENQSHRWADLWSAKRK